MLHMNNLLILITCMSEHMLLLSMQVVLLLLTVFARPFFLCKLVTWLIDGAQICEHIKQHLMAPKFANISNSSNEAPLHLILKFKKKPQGVYHGMIESQRRVCTNVTHASSTQHQYMPLIFVHHAAIKCKLNQEPKRHLCKITFPPTIEHLNCSEYSAHKWKPPLYNSIVPQEWELFTECHTIHQQLEEYFEWHFHSILLRVWEETKFCILFGACLFWV